MLSLTPELRAFLASLDKNEYNPSPRPFLNRAPTHALHILTDGITPHALARAHTPTFDTLIARGVSASDARGIFPTITGPSHTSMLTGARVGTHGFLYPKMLDAFGNRLLEFSEGLMQAETIAEAWRPRGITTAGIGSRFLRGADMMITEGVVGEDHIEITERAINAIREWQPHYLHVVYYIADSAGHLYGPDSDETLWAIEQIDQMTARLLNGYADKNLDNELVVAVNADHGMVPVLNTIPHSFAEYAGAFPQGRVALAPHAFDDATFDALMNDERVNDIFARDELELLGAYGPRWGEHVLQLREGWMFVTRKEMKGYHGAWSETDRHIPLILSGAGIRAGSSLTTCEIIDLAPTLSVLLGGAIPENNQGRILWEILDVVQNAPNVGAYLDLLTQRDNALEELKQLKHQRASGELLCDEYETERGEILLSARANLLALEEERKKLERWIEMA
ncbi:MAG TPA: alkaline phosphatase family protein [Anaerolineae bacterium]|nr:alkaline phosphatase family protein [Anaerolineae bacterium]